MSLHKNESADIRDRFVVISDQSYNPLRHYCGATLPRNGQKVPGEIDLAPADAAKVLAAFRNPNDKNISIGCDTYQHSSCLALCDDFHCLLKVSSEVEE